MLPTIIADAICIIFLIALPIYATVAYLQLDDRSTDKNTGERFAIQLTASILTVITVVYLYIVEFSLYHAMVDKNNATAQNQPIRFDA